MSSHARRFGIGLSVCALAIAAGGTPAEETGYLRFDLTLDKGYLGPDGKAPPQPITVSLHCCGGRFNFGWAVMPGTTDFREVDARGLKIEGGRLAGQVKLVLDAHKGEYTYHDFDYEWIKGKRVPVYTYALEATRQGAELAGSWKGGWEVSGKTNALTGAAVKGRIWTHAQLAAAQAIAKGQDFPCHRGADGSASLPATGQEMVSSWDEARFVWRSEEYVPGAWSDGDFGGYAAPVIADGLIYMNYCEAEDDGAVLPFEGKQARWYGGHPARLKRRAFSAAWKDVLLCMDAATGMTVWKAEIPGGTDARHGNKKKGCHVPAAVWKAKLRCAGSLPDAARHAPAHSPIHAAGRWLLNRRCEPNQALFEDTIHGLARRHRPVPVATFTIVWHTGVLSSGWPARRVGPKEAAERDPEIQRNGILQSPKALHG